MKPCPRCDAALLISPPCNDAPDEDWQLNAWQACCSYCSFVSGSYETLEELEENWG